MKKVVIVSLGPKGREEDFEYEFLGEKVEVEWLATDGDVGRAADLIARHDGKADAIGLDSMNRAYHVGGKDYPITEVASIVREAVATPVVDGSNLKRTLERWAVSWIAETFPELLKPHTHIFMPCGVDRWHMAKVFTEYTQNLEFGDAMLHWSWPWTLKGLDRLEAYAEWFLPWVCDRPYKALYPTGRRQDEASPRFAKAFRKAEILVGGLHYIRRYAPQDIRNKVIVTNALGAGDLEDLRDRGVRTVFTTTPEMNGRSYGTNVLEAVMVAASGKNVRDLKTDDFLGMISDSKIEPRVVYPRGKPVEVEKFAFVIHPLKASQLFNHPTLRYLKFLPETWVEWLCHHFGPPMYLSKVTGAKSATGKELEGWLYAVTGTPKMLMKARPEGVYRDILKIAQWSEKAGAGILGLGAFTSVVGDAGVTIAKEADIAITSGNSYTVASTLEAAKQVCRKMGHDPNNFSAMVIGATGSIGKICSRLIANVSQRLHLVAPRPERLLELQKQIQAETPGCEVTIATHSDAHVEDPDLIITTTTSRGGRLIDFARLKPGCVVCDVARPLDIKEADAADRPDVLVIESGELEVPGPVNFGTDIGLPPKTAYACLSETMILAMEGKYEDYTLGRNLEMHRVKEIYKLGKKHGFKLAAIRSFGKVVNDTGIRLVRERANEARAHMGIPPLGPPVPEPDEARKADGAAS